MRQKIFNVLSVLFGLLLVNGGLNKFFNYMPVPDDLPEALMRDFAALQEIEWLMPLIALAELMGGILIFFPRTRALGALIVFPVMVGVLLTHIFVEPGGLIIALVIWAMLGWIIHENRERFLPIIR
jgi:uncharacterized membrane protein YphA (DoxX/SURF4 family)